MIMLRSKLTRTHITIKYYDGRTFATSATNPSYGGTWKNVRRIKNPNIVDKIQVKEHVPSGKLQPSRLIYVCGLGITGSIGLPKFYRPDKKSPDEHHNSTIGTATFKRLSVFGKSDRIIDVACGYGFTIVAAHVSGSEHTALGFGLNDCSQIGYKAQRPGFPLEIVANPAPIWLPTKSPINKVSCGRAHSLLCNEVGQVFSLGNNSLGQCGRPINEKEVYFGSKAVHTIKDLPSNIKQIECGQDHSMFLTDDGQLYTCGWGADGQTGLGHFETVWKPTLVKCDIEGVKLNKISTRADTVLALDNEGNVWGWGNSEYAQFHEMAGDVREQFNSPRLLKLSRDVHGKIVDIAAGGTMCAVLNDKGQVFVWGFGILGKGPKVDHLRRPSLIPETLFGVNSYDPQVKVVKIFAGLSQFAAINNRGDLFTWGKNRGNLLGFSHRDNQYFPMRVNMDLAATRKISLGVDHSCVIAEKIF